MQWSATTAELKAEHRQEKVATEFAFRNDGPRALRFVSLQPSCDCTTAAASKAVFAPGEAGVVSVEFTVGSRLGRQEKFVTVTTDDPAEPPVNLKLVIDIPEPVAISARQLFWAKDAPAEAQAIVITVANPEKSTVTSAECADERFTTTVEPGPTKGSYHLIVRPTTTAMLAQAAVRVTTVIAGHPQVSVVVVGVR